MAVLRKSGLVAAVLSAGLVLAIPSLPVAAQEQPTPLPGAQEHWGNGFYYLLDFDMGDSANPVTDADFGVDLDWSLGVGLGVGYRLAGMVRLEGEFHSNYFRAGSLDLGPAAPFPTFDYSGGVTAQGVMANLIFDLPAWGTARPYIGGGYGFSRVSADYNESVCYIICFSTKNEIVDDWDFAEAWQVMVGISFSNWSSSSETFVGYRYFETDDLDFRTLSGTPFIQEGIENHSLTIGMRFLM